MLRIDCSQTPTQLTLAVSENHSLVKQIFVGWELVVLPANAYVFPVVVSLCPTGNRSVFTGYQLLYIIIYKKVAAFVDHRTNIGWIDTVQTANRTKNSCFTVIHLNRENTLQISWEFLYAGH